MKKYKYETGLIASAFDLFHAGHVLYAKEAKYLCKYVYAGLHINPQLERSEKNKPIQSVEERLIQLEGCKYIDFIFLYNTEKELIDSMDYYKIDVWILGSDNKHKNIPTKKYVKNLHYHDRTIHNYSSSDLRKRIIGDKK